MARMASSDWLTSRGASWLCSKTSPATTTNSAPVSATSAPRPATASRRAAEYRGCASPLRKWRVMPSCQSAVCRKRIRSSPSLVAARRLTGMASVGPALRQVRGPRTACARNVLVDDATTYRHPAAAAARQVGLSGRGGRPRPAAGAARHPRGARWPATGSGPTRPPSTRCCARRRPAPARRWPAPASRRPSEFDDRLYDSTPGTVLDVINGVGSTTSARCWSSATSRRCRSWRSALPTRTPAMPTAAEQHLDEVPDLGDRGPATSTAPWDGLDTAQRDAGRPSTCRASAV